MVSPLEEQELSGSRGTAHFALKWSRDARHEASLSLQHIKGVTRALTAADAGKFVPIVAFECRGLDPIAWQPQASGKGWCCMLRAWAWVPGRPRNSARPCPFQYTTERAHAPTPAGRLRHKGAERHGVGGRGPFQWGVGRV